MLSSSTVHDLANYISSRLYLIVIHIMELFKLQKIDSHKCHGKIKQNEICSPDSEIELLVITMTT